MLIKRILFHSSAEFSDFTGQKFLFHLDSRAGCKVHALILMHYHFDILTANSQERKGSKSIRKYKYNNAVKLGDVSFMD